MTREEVKSLVEKVKLYRPMFKGMLGTEGLLRLIGEWYEKLEPYDYEDINKNLDDFFKDENNLSKYPDVFQLMRNTPTIEQKAQKGKVKVTCQFCGRWFDVTEKDTHEDRCRSIKYMDKIKKRYFGMGLKDKRELYQMSQAEFDEKYYKCLELCLPRAKAKGHISDARGIENVLATRNGGKPIWTYNDVVGG